MQSNDAIAGTIDVVIPMRNGAATIVQAVASAAAQTVLPHRIIVVDDGSTDGGTRLVRDHPLVELIETPPVGVSHARNTGARAARSVFVAFLDCDDLWRPRKLERQLSVARDHPHAALVTCDHIGATPSGTVLPAMQIRPRFEGWVLQELLGSCFQLGGWSSSMLVRRDAFLLVGGYDETRRYFEDIDLCFALAARYPFAMCAEVLTYVIENPDSTMRRTAAPAFVLEMTMQSLMIVDKWFAASDSPARLDREAARFILSKFLRNRLLPAHLSVLREQMARRTPVLASRIARSMPHLALCLAYAGVAGAGRMIAGTRRHYQRKAASDLRPPVVRAESAA